MSVNVGLETSSSGAAPNPLTIPLASVVFPAPSLRINSTTARRGSHAAIRRPSSMVSSSECVSNTLTDRPRQVMQQVGRDQALFSQLFGANLARPAVQPHRRAHSGPDLGVK